jgi:hypothetical protein
MAPTLANTIGAAYLGIVASCILFGITNVQVYVYYLRYGARDSMLHKISVAILWVLDALHLGITVSVGYHYLMVGFSGINAIPATLKLQSILNIIIVVFVQGLYVVRLWKLSKGLNSSRAIPVVVGIIIAVAGVLAIYVVALLTKIDTLVNLTKVHWGIQASFGASTAVDSVIAAAICYYLQKSRSGFIQSNTVVSTLMQYTLCSGLLTSACSLSTLTAFTIVPDNMIFLGIEFSLAKVYVNSFIAMLNARDSIRAKQDGNCDISVNLSRVRSLPPGSNPSGHAESDKLSVYPITPLTTITPITPIGGCREVVTNQVYGSPKSAFHLPRADESNSNSV